MPRYNQPRKTWQYTNEFKAKAVELTHFEDIKSGRDSVPITLDLKLPARIGLSVRSTFCPN